MNCNLQNFLISPKKDGGEIEGWQSQKGVDILEMPTAQIGKVVNPPQR
jgi:hypothetical protein